MSEEITQTLDEYISSLGRYEDVVEEKTFDLKGSLKELGNQMISELKESIKEWEKIA